MVCNCKTLLLCRSFIFLGVINGQVPKMKIQSLCTKCWPVKFCSPQHNSGAPQQKMGYILLVQQDPGLWNPQDLKLFWNGFFQLFFFTFWNKSSFTSVVYENATTVFFAVKLQECFVDKNLHLIFSWHEGE